MIRALVNLLVGCRHRRVTRPITPLHKTVSEPGATYVACLECGQRLHYDLATMSMGAVIPNLPGDERFQTSH
jgi:hypothetical protein